MDEQKISWDDNTCKVIHTKCHWKRYHSDKKMPYDTKHDSKCTIL